MDVSQPLFIIGIKDEIADTKERVRKHIAIEILLNMIIGKSSKLYKELYDSTLTVARQFADKNKFMISGEYQASNGAQIRLNAMNVPRGSRNSRWGNFG